MLTTLHVSIKLCIHSFITLTSYPLHSVAPPFLLPPNQQAPPIHPPSIFSLPAILLHTLTTTTTTTTATTKPQLCTSIARFNNVSTTTLSHLAVQPQPRNSRNTCVHSHFRPEVHMLLHVGIKTRVCTRNHSRSQIAVWDGEGFDVPNVFGVLGDGAVG